MKIIKLILILTLAMVFCIPVIAQQTDINRYTLFTGFDYMVSPARNLTERGFETDFGVTAKPWLGLGVDFGVLTGAGTITGTETVYAPLIQQLPPQLGITPGGIHVPFNSTTYTFAAGPQFYVRKWKQVTFLIRPGFGGMHERADLPVSLAPLFQLLKVPAPNAHQTDTKLFFGMGAGFDLNVSRTVGVRFAADWVNTHLFSNMLTPRQNYVRLSIGPTFRWGQLKSSR